MTEDAPSGTDLPLGRPRSPGVLLPVVLVAFAANSLITRHVVGKSLLDAGLLSGVRFVAGAVALLGLSLARSERPVVGSANVRPALWLGIYAVCISYGYRYIGAAAGTFVFYASVLLTLVAGDLARRTPIAASRLIGAAVSLLGIGVLASGSTGTVSVRGVLLLAATGVAWGLYTAAGRTTADPRVATTGHFVLLAAVILFPTVVGAASGLRVTGSGLGWAVAMGAGTTAFAYVAWYVCQRSLSGAAAGSVQLVIPVITAIGAVVLLGEAISLRLFVAAAMVMGGHVAGSRTEHRSAGQSRLTTPASDGPTPGRRPSWRRGSDPAHALLSGRGDGPTLPSRAAMSSTAVWVCGSGCVARWLAPRA